MSARDALFNDIWDMRTADEKNALINAHRDEVALEIGRDAMRDGLVPTLTRMVGEANATKLMADYRDALAHELAEKIRVMASELVDEAGPRTTPSDPKYDKGAGAVLAADLIDPLKDAT